MSHHHYDMYHENPANRSPGSHRQLHQQTLHRQSSRQFDVYGQLPGLYTAEDHAARYDSGRFDRISSATLHSNYAYDMGAQTWNTSGFGAPNPLAAIGATGRMKPSTRRNQLPSVSGKFFFPF